jgi:hypothetical protein
LANLLGLIMVDFTAERGSSESFHNKRNARTRVFHNRT